VCLVVGLVAVLVLGVATAVREARTSRTHAAPIVLVGPEIVAVEVARDANRLAGHPFDARTATTAEAGRGALLRGDAVAVLVIDLATTQDTLLLPASSRPELERALVARIRAVETRYGRTSRVERLEGPVRHGPRFAAVGQATAAAGLGLVLVVSLAWGPVARTLRRGLLRLAGLAALSLAAAAAGAPGPLGGRGGGGVGVLVGLGVLGAGWLTLALEALAGLWGLVVAVAVVLVPPALLLVAGDPLLLPPLWARLIGWTSGGAVAEGLQRFTSPRGSALGPFLVVSGTAFVGVLVLVSTRFDGVRTSPRPGARPGAVPTTLRWRVQLSAVLAVLVAASAVLAATLPERRSSPRPSLPSLASSTTCEPTGPLRSVADLNRLTELRGSTAFQGGDVGAESRLQDGRRLWLFGDTLRDLGTAGQRFVRNSMLVVEPGCLQVVVPASGGAVVPDRGDGIGYWPMSVATAERPGYDLVAVTSQRVRSTSGNDAFAFENLGPATAVFVVPRGGTPQLIALRDVGPDSADPTRPMWGAATADSEGWLYLYGTARPDDGTATGFSLRVARVRPEELLRPERWRYWDGAAWVGTPGDAAELVTSDGGVSQTLSVFERDGTWYAFSKRGEFLGNDLVFWTAPAPWGPFTAQPAVAALPSNATTGELRYMPLAHPDLLPRDGSVLVSYSRNQTDLGQVLQDPLLYRPRFLRLPLPVPAGG
jgi:hypothetical protein